MTSVLINLALFKVAWAATVFAAAGNRPVLGVIAVGIAAAVHLLRSANGRAESLLLLAAAATGFGWESFLVATGLLEYESGNLIPGVAPYWIVAMWVLFATTLNVGMRWLQKSVVVAAIAGGIGGPLSFLAGAGAGAVNLTEPTVSLLVIGAGWAVMLPILTRFAMHLDGHTNKEYVNAIHKHHA